MRRDWSGSLVGSVPVVVGFWRTRILYTRRETAPQTFREETGHRGLRGEGRGERGGERGMEREGERGKGERGDRGEEREREGERGGRERGGIEGEKSGEDQSGFKKRKRVNNIQKY